MPSRLAAAVAVGCLLLGGCATVGSEKAFDNASVGMSKADVLKGIGRPAIVRCVTKNAYCQKLEVWEYKVGRGKGFEQVVTEAAFTTLTIGAGAPLLISAAETDRYWLYFVDGKFAGWSRAGDWSRDAEMVRKTKFRPELNVSQMI